MRLTRFSHKLALVTKLVVVLIWGLTAFCQDSTNALAAHTTPGADRSGPIRSEYKDPKFGIIATIPTNWRVIPAPALGLGGATSFTTIQSPQKTYGKEIPVTELKLDIGVATLDKPSTMSLSDWAMQNQLGESKILSTRMGNRSGYQFLKLDVITPNRGSATVWFFNRDTIVYFAIAMPHNSIYKELAEEVVNSISFSGNRIHLQTVIKSSVSINLTPRQQRIDAPSGYRLPFNGKKIITTGPGCYYTHQNASAEAIDYALNYEDVLASQGGEVVFSQDGWNDGFGSLMKVRHSDGNVSWYAHLNSRKKSSGTVSRGEIIAQSGNTGNSTGAHLHFEVRNSNGQSIWIRDLPTTTWYTGNINSPCMPPGQNDGEATPTDGGGSGGPSGYTFCANENQRCSFSGTKDVAYGANDRFNYKYGITGGIDCNNATFGDPISGVGKACYTKDSASSCPTVSGRVNVYDGTNCSGDSAVADAPGGWSMANSFNDRAESVAIPSGWSARLYLHDSWDSPNVCIPSTASDLRNYRFSDGQTAENKATRMWVYDRSNCELPTPGAPSLVSPGNNATVGRYEGVTLSWNTASNASQYYAEFWGGPNVSLKSDWTSGTSFFVGDNFWGGTYQWHVKARNSNGQESGWSETRTLYRRYGSPANLSAWTVSTSQIGLSWGASADANNIQGYRIYRNGSAIATVGNSSTSYTDGGLSCGTSYNYVVRAYNGGLESDSSNSANASTSACAPDAPSLSSPANNAAVGRFDNITLSWNSANRATQYYAEFWGGPGISLKSDWRSGTSWYIGSTWGGSYQWRVKSKDDAGRESGWSETRTLHVEYDRPTGLSATGVSQSQVNLAWAASADAPGNIDGYRIYRNGSAVGTVGSGTTSYGDTGLSCGTEYSYWAVAYRGGTESGHSNTAYGTTRPCAPAAPTLLAPANGGVYRPNYDFTLSWEGQGAAFYARLWGGPAIDINSNWQGGKTWHIGTLWEGAYQWQVKARNVDAAEGPWSNTWSFIVDGTPPTNPTSATSTPPASTWSNDNTVEVAWSGASDNLSGVAGYSIQWSQSAGTVPDATQDTAATSLTSDPLADGAWYLHVRAVDAAGNWAAGAAHFGPYRIDTAAPNPPAGGREAACGVSDGVWQRTCADPRFAWTAATDNGASGVAGYAVYWGPDSNGTGATIVSSAAYDPPAVSGSGVLHLRAATRDRAGNASAWVTLFTFRYDNTPPPNPDVAVETACGVTSGAWQTACADPAFTWARPLDPLSGVSGYNVYWGPLADGVSLSNWRTTESYDPAPVGNLVTYYLRVQTKDVVGNLAPWTTLFTFMRDAAPPSNPTALVSSDPLTRTWSADNTVTASWTGAADGAGSGLAGYAIEWSTVATTVPAATLTTPGSSATSPPLATGNSWWLHVRAADKVGNWNAGARHFGPFYVDVTPPDPAGPAVEAAGVISGAWQRTVRAPRFTWPTPADLGSGIARYNIYWGTAINGTGTFSTTARAHNPPAVSATGTYYLRLQTVDRVGNLSPWQTAFVFRYDATPPGAPGPARERHGVPDGRWQRTVADPAFTWPAATDDGAGVAHYLLYWGASPSGSGTTISVTLPAYTPPPVPAPGTYYLRAAAVDAASNRGPWTTLFTFRYDNVPPANPTSATEDHGVPQDTWQRAVSAPSFRWRGAADANSRLDGYFVYWGINPAGVSSSNFMTTTTYTPAAVSSQNTYYLRLRTRDLAGNLADWATLFTFKYDGTPPTNPTTLVSSEPLTRTWSNDNTVFVRWAGAADGNGSGVAGYATEWTTTAATVPAATQTTAAAETTSPPLATANSWYLHVRTRDNVGNWNAGARHFGPFYIDVTPPAPVGNAVAAGGVVSGTWQNTVAQPAFTWPRPADEGAGVVRYYVYWGSNPTGTATFSTTVAAHTPSPVSGTGTYYLRLQPEDGAGNRGAWRTAFILRYDPVAPACPTNIREANRVVSGAWQATVAAPAFTWAPGSDAGGSGVTGHYMYWGPSATGTSNVLTTTTAFNPAALPATAQYFLRLRPRDNAGNLGDWCDVFAFRYDPDPPADTGLAREVGGALNDRWQRTVNDPEFTWTAPADPRGGSGVAGYAVYWGTLPDGTSTTFSTAPTFNPRAVAGVGTYYLRLRPRDAVGNWGNWRTAFTFRYDATPPGAPGQGIDRNGAPANRWQRFTNDPDLIWPEAADQPLGAGVSGYYLYWGPQADGTGTIWRADAAYDPPAVANPATYYLRAQARDAAGNLGNWTTLFVLKYDARPPGTAQNVTEQSGVVSGRWQNTVADPLFTWTAAADVGSGVAGYYVYFGPNATGIGSRWVTTTTFDAPALATPATYFLRLQARDLAGNLGSWATLFTFRYDGTPPAPPTTVTPDAAHRPGSWSNDDTIDVRWSGASDLGGSGLAGYAVAWNAAPEALPDASLFQTSTFTTSLALATDTAWYVHIRPRDLAGNWSTAAAHQGPFFIDTSPPRAPGLAIEGSAVISGSWQNRINDPIFRWAPSADSGSGAVAYDLYWGSDPAGTGTLRVTAPTYNPPPVPGEGQYYLRGRAQDLAGNLSDWSTLFVFAYDSTPPSPLLPATEARGVQDNTWQKAVKDPAFTWPAATSTNAGVIGYEVYWGADPVGRAITAAPGTPAFDPPAVPGDGAYFLRARAVDAAGNANAWATIFTFRYDATPPEPPALAGSDPPIGAWSSDNTIAVRWLPAPDGAGSGGAAYALAWTKSATTLPSAIVNVTQPMTTSQPLASGIWYLHVRPRDQVGNWGAAAAQFGPFQIDTAPPRAPALASETHGVTHDRWQNAIADPAFQWTPPDGTGSQVAGYYVYWGEEITGTADLRINDPAYDPPALTAPGVRYLRVQTVDVAGNRSAWSTLFTFRYDATPPVNPTVATETHSAPNDTWQRTIGDPAFTWPAATDIGAGVAAYRIYWGPDPGGAIVTLETVARVYDPPILLSPSVYYLRLQTRDGAGNLAPWITLFTFKYDATPPLAPAALVSRSHPAGAWSADRTVDVSWAPASDGPGGSGIAGYSVAWSTATTTLPDTIVDLEKEAATSPELATGAWYVHIRPRDLAGNWAPTAAHFGPFQVDVSAPRAPGMATDAGQVVSDRWQNTRNQPDLAWIAPADPGSGIAGYRVYWGANPLGTASRWITTTVYRPAVVANPSVSYLRLQAVDQTGNASDWTTSFVYRYDARTPGAPGRAVEANGVANNVWQNRVNTPEFAWPAATDVGSGIAGYNIYWGADPAGEATRLSTTASFAPAPVTAANTYYLRARSRDNAGNSGVWTTIFTFRYDATPPGNPTAVVEASGAVNNRWQNSVSDPRFTWTAALDSGSGLAGYRVYWGPDPAGTATAWLGASAFDPPAVTSPSVNYLRLQPWDQAGNAGAWITAFTFRFDPNRPDLPTGAIETHSVPDGVWQNAVRNPAFTWVPTADTGSGVAGYRVYWGPAADGTGAAWTPTAAFTPTAVTTAGTFFLRAQAVDAAANASDWATLFTFRYDATPPARPSLVQEQGGARSAVCQNIVADPRFTWPPANDLHAGVSGYRVYWGADPAGASELTTNEPVFDPSALGSSTTLYLRLQSLDAAGNASAWVTGFVFCYDADGPEAPTSATEDGGAPNDVWQKAVARPRFRWQPAPRPDSDLAGYDVYWGPDPAGIGSTRVVTSTYVPPAPATGLYFLRAQPIDRAGNRGPWTNLFTFRFDNTPPPLPTDVHEISGALNDTWQNGVSDPAFAWSQINDLGSGLANYRFYWGASASGTTTDWISATTTYDPPPLAGSGVYYLRMQTQDAVGNTSPWATVFIFRYDGAAPGVARSAVDGNGAPNAKWQNAWPDPSFTWTAAGDTGGSQIAGYAVYWGADAQATTPTHWVTTTVFDPPPVLDPSVNYLRVQAQDNAGNRGPWAQLFTFKYDATPPANPTALTGSHFTRTWSTDNTVALRWTGASDGSGAGVAGYAVAWTLEPTSIPTATLNVSSTATTSPPLPDGAWYAHVRAVDAAGNWNADAVHHGPFWLDTLPPPSPATAREVGRALSDTWQRTVADPSFTWSAVTDPIPGSDLAGYQVYWGSNPAGVAPTTWVTMTAYDPPALPSPSVAYLRLRAQDQAGNQGPWQTAFIFRYDATAPANPTSFTPDADHPVATWTNNPQVTVNWSGATDGAGSGVAGYSAAWTRSTTTLPGASPFITETRSTSPLLTTSDQWYLHVRTRDAAGNWAATAAHYGPFFIDASPPAVPGLALEASKAISGTWQRLVSRPNFTWNPPYDAGSGVASYNFYWGPDLAGTGIVSVTQAAYAPPAPPAPGLHYLRLQAVDATGNAGAWGTAFAYAYDPLPPSNPLTITEASGVISGTWQAAVSDASFTWTGAADNLSGVAGYYVYWGTNALGASSLYTTTAAYDPPALAAAPATYYLRLRTRDVAGNLTPWYTAFVFRYGTAPAQAVLPIEGDDVEPPDETLTDEAPTEPPDGPPVADAPPTAEPPPAPAIGVKYRILLPIVFH